MFRLVVAFVLVFGGLAVYIAIQDERAAQQPTHQSSQSNEGAASAEANESHPQQDIHNAERDTPSWYRFFRWPAGTTTWAILATLLAIAYQAREMTRSTDLMNRQADIQAAALRQWVDVDTGEMTLPAFPKKPS